MRQVGAYKLVRPGCRCEKCGGQARIIRDKIRRRESIAINDAGQVTLETFVSCPRCGSYTKPITYDVIGPDQS